MGKEADGGVGRGPGGPPHTWPSHRAPRHNAAIATTFRDTTLVAGLRLVEADSVVIQYRSYRALQGGPCLDIGSFGGEFGGTRLRDVTLILDHEKAGGCAFR